LIGSFAVLVSFARRQQAGLVLTRVGKNFPKAGSA
jgi:hypothetical protein